MMRSLLLLLAFFVGGDGAAATDIGIR